MSRALVLDTETTGFDPLTGDRVLEVAAVELVNLVPTGRTFHVLIDPEREVPEEAAKVHGFTWEMLRGKPKFAEIAPAMLEFLGDDPVVAHNAPFDFGFLDFELKKAGHTVIDRARMVDTLALAKKRFPGLPNSLDALCRRYGIDNSMRTSHNALLDVQLLAQVYLELMGGKQPGLALASRPAVSAPTALQLEAGPVARTPRPIVPSAAELEAHRAFLGKVKEPIWLSLLEDAPKPEA
ncbi:DNA polymerase III subunit epsilon [Roseomonas sp. E05]|uniref:DNA polymerase III subunit epsilon n=1 Tax=Roseomonas sp. E05 TaxID=3046310 RepID=UPI0024B8B536|nr:DNA polymerase III subunit epsilon [Roseomonas sp. E05]MDJ0388164.1 DNA polymerase III subunit epsilon [Roseomonas sp. E05]